MAKFYTPTRLSENISETPEGYLVCVGVAIARTGWQLYGEGETPLETDDEGKILIYRDEKDVFHPHHMASYEGKSVTIRHPGEFVTPHTWGSLSKGIAQNIRRGTEKNADGEDELLADLLVTDAIAIGLVKNGLREVSCGYEAEYEQTEPGKGKQINIIGNHIALVEEGRAGPTCAIFDHKHEGSVMSKLAEKMKTLFGKAVDEAVAEEKKEEKKEESGDANMYDELVNMVKDLGAKIEGMANAGKDEAKPEMKTEKKDEEKAKDEEAGMAGSSVEERLQAIELAIAKLMEAESAEAAVIGDEEKEESEESKDEESDMLTGDEKSRVEILAPGLKISKGTDAKIKALETAYATKEGQKAIHALNGGKKPVFDSAEKVNALFIAASEVLKASRGHGLESSKNPKGFKVGDSGNVAMTPEKLNEINQAHWAKK